MDNLKLLSRVALSFKDLKNFDDEMNEVLAFVGEFMDVSRVYIFLNEKDDTINNTFEWCNNGILPQIENLQDIKFKTNVFQNMLERDGYICSSNIDHMEKSIRDTLRPQGIKSIVIYPIFIKKEIRGFIGFDECLSTRVWKEEELEILRTISGILGNVYERKMFEEKRVESENIFRLFSKIFDKNPLPMCITSIGDDKFIRVNPAFTKKTGYSQAEVIGRSLEEMDMFLDYEKMKLLRQRKLNKEEVKDEELRVRCKDGTPLSGLFSVELIKSQGKESFLTVMVDITRRKEAEVALRESEKRFFLALDKTKAGLWDVDMVKGEVFLSPMWKKILGYEDHEIQNNFEGWQTRSHPHDKQELEKQRNAYLEGRSKKYEVVHRLKHKDGNWRWILTRGGILRDEFGHPQRWIGTNIDITEEHEQSLELERFFSINLDLLCIIDLEGRFMKTNKAWEEILGHSSQELKGRPFRDFIHPDDLEKTQKIVKLLTSQGKVTNFVNRYLSTNGNYHYLEWKANLYGDIMYAAARDITERIDYENKILEISHRDALTQVYNRRYVYEVAAKTIEEYKRKGNEFSVCILDIDRFKKINDNYGHQTGDYVLKEFTKTIEKNLRLYDVLGRYGGEEFIIILKNSDMKESKLVIERVLKSVREKTFSSNGLDIKVSFSAGISHCREIEKEKMIIDDLIEIADRRMYDAKKAGRNRIVSLDCKTSSLPV